MWLCSFNIVKKTNFEWSVIYQSSRQEQLLHSQNWRLESSVMYILSTTVSNYMYKQFHQHQEGDDVITDLCNLASEQNKNKTRNLISDQSSYTLNIHYAQKQEAQISYLRQASCAIGDALEYLTWSPAAAPEERRCPAGPVSYLPALSGCLGHP